MQKVRTMLYVDDVEQVVDFWQNKLGAQVVEVNALPDDSENIVVTVAPNVELSFFAKSFIRQYSPEVLGAIPSLILYSRDFEGLHDRLTTAGKIVENNGTRTFNFRDPEGNYFVIGEAK